ncbi:hypothetical protein EVG20_g9248 [Dentipellis fragilis]|uniref:Protein kinase domain-containing protein n=1 Tax=Dentipellis fragilis TaxID=205917 RepID=A0A4Y9Y2M3_9AGAM|nr:hypothetical protein EVG20_g9248 [Dentipellis fragilis]
MESNHPTYTFVLYYPRPGCPQATSSNCVDLVRTSAELLLNNANPQLPISDTDKFKLFLMKPEGLSLEPKETLFYRVRDWLLANLHRIYDPKERLHLQSPLCFKFPEGPSGEVDILVFDRNIVETFDRDGARRICPAYIINECENITYKNIEAAPEPSECVKDRTSLTKVLSSDAAIIHGGRPSANCGLPPALFHPALAKLDHHLRNLDKNLEELQPEPNLLCEVHGLFQSSLSVFEDEEERNGTLCTQMLELLTPEDWSMPLIYRATPSVVFGTPCVTIIEEIKSESGMGGNAFLQAAISYAEIVSDPRYEGASFRTNHPVVLVGLMGDYVEIGSAVFLADGVYYSHPYSQKLSLDFHASNHIFRLAQAFSAVNIAVNSIHNFYSQFIDHPPPSDSIAHLFPSPTPLDDEPPLPALTFISRLSKTGDSRYVVPETEEERRSGLYIAHMPRPTMAAGVQADNTPNTIEVLVKFTPRYNPHAHQLLAEVGLAPTLHACRKYVKSWKDMPQAVFADVEKAVKILHENHIVFGNLQPCNILCLPSPAGLRSPERTGGMLVDFDWAAVDGQGRYPATLPEELFLWASSVDRYSVLEYCARSMTCKCSINCGVCG